MSKNGKPLSAAAIAAAVRDLPVHVRPVRCWHSGGGEFAGYYVGIFGPNAFGTYGFLIPALAGVDAANLKAHQLHLTEEEALSVWSHANPIPIPDNLTGITRAVAKRADELGLYRSLAVRAAE